MLRMSVHQSENEITVQFEGRLDQPNIAEAERFLRTILYEHPSGRVCVDLRNVTFLDEKGKEILKELAPKVSRFLASGCLIRPYVDQLTRSVNSNQTLQGSPRS